MLRGNHVETWVSTALQRLEPTAPPLDELGRDPLSFLAGWVEYASTSSVGQTWIALLALGLSIAAFTGQFFKGRKAELSVRFARTPDYKYKADRLVIINHGSASAKKIKLSLTVDLEAKDAIEYNGEVHYPALEAGKHSWIPWRKDEDPFPIAVLAPGASFHVPVNVSGNQRYEAPFALAKLTWRDKRILNQNWESTVSSTGQLLGGGPSLEKYDEERNSRIMGLLH